MRDLQAANLDPHDYRLHGQPRFAPENITENNKLLDSIEAFAARKGCSVGQLALAWLHAQGDDVISIPGTTKIAHLLDNLAAMDISLSREELDEINSILNCHDVKGDRYAHMNLTFHTQK